MTPLEQRIAEAFRTWNERANGGAVSLRYYPSTDEIWGKVEGYSWNQVPEGGKVVWENVIRDCINRDCQ